MDNIFELTEDDSDNQDNASFLMPHFAWLDELNTEQKSAVQCTQGPVLVNYAPLSITEDKENEKW